MSAFRAIMGAVVSLVFLVVVVWMAVQKWLAADPPAPVANVAQHVEDWRAKWNGNFERVADDLYDAAVGRDRFALRSSPRGAVQRIFYVPFDMRLPPQPDHPQGRIPPDVETLGKQLRAAGFDLSVASGSRASVLGKILHADPETTVVLVILTNRRGQARYSTRRLYYAKGLLRVAADLGRHLVIVEWRSDPDRVAIGQVARALDSIPTRSWPGMSESAQRLMENTNGFSFAVHWGEVRKSGFLHVHSKSVGGSGGR